MLTLRTTKGSELTWIELDQNFTFLEGLINDAQDTINNIVTINTIQTITGQKDFSQLIKTDGIISRTSTNGGGYIDVNDGQISIGTGLNAADGTPEISIENKGYGMGVIFAPSDGTVFRTGATFNQSVSFDQDAYVNNLYGNYIQISTLLLGTTDIMNYINAKQATLVSGTNIKTVNGNSLLGTGNLALTYTKADVGLGNVDNTTDLAKPISTLTQTALNAKQATLVSGTNIKTVNGVSILGTGDITIAAGGIQKARFTATEGQLAFVCTGITLNDPLVYLNGILQDQGDVYTYAGSTVTFVSARYLNEKIVVVQ